MIKKYFLFSMLFFITGLNFANPAEAEDIFQMTTKLVDPNTFTLHWQIKPGYFLYKNSIQLTEPSNRNFNLGTLRFPKPVIKTDRQNRSYPVYRHQLILPVAILGEQAGEALLDLHFQGCANDGFCYPPQFKQVKLTIDQKLALTQVAVENPVTGKPMNDIPENQIDHILSTDNLALILFGFLGFGLLLSFTPCVLPMIPVLSGIIVGHGQNLSTRKAFFLSLSYVLSMAVTYATVGAIVALMGHNLQIAMQSPGVISAFSFIFVLLALSMFNFYELRLPVSWQNKLARVTRTHEGGHYVGAALMGCLSTLVISPCVTAPLIGALSYIAQTGHIIFGGLALFSLGLGMGIPLLLIGTSAGKWLPKAGHWMNAVKAFFGVLLLGMAIYLMERILPATLIMALWGSILVFSGIYLGALTKSITNVEKFFQGSGILLLFYGLLIIFGASQGNTNPLQPLASLNKPNPITNIQPFMIIKTVDEAKQALASAKGKPVMLDFYADWCASCKVMAKTTLQDPRVLSVLHDFVVLKIDLTANDANTKALLRFFNVVAPPTFVFYDAQGEELTHLRMVGEISTDSFYDKLVKATEF